MQEDGTAKFVREGEYWTLIHQGVVTRLQDRKGLKHLAQLLARPNVEIHALDLAGGVEPVTSDTPILDERAKRTYRQRLEVLRDRLDDARDRGDTARADTLAAELEAVATELARSIGLGGRDRGVPSASERARINATRTIRDAIARITQANDELGHYLQVTVRTGTFCCYDPHPRQALRWNIVA